MPERDDEFFIGYLPSAPQGIASRTRGLVIFMLVVVGALALVFVTGQQRFAPGFYEYGIIKEFRGVMVEQPYPTLLVPRPCAKVGSSFSRYLLVASGKRGAREIVAGMQGRAVTLAGSLVYRDGRTMVEIEGGSVQPWTGEEAARVEARWSRSVIDLGERTLEGEIVDSKCYLGVMKPANWKPHRSCAARCISGGIPPLFVVRDAAGKTMDLLLVSSDGKAVNDEVLDFVAEPVAITGRLAREGDALVFRADPATYRRLSR